MLYDLITGFLILSTCIFWYILAYKFFDVDKDVKQEVVK